MSQRLLATTYAVYVVVVLYLVLAPAQGAPGAPTKLVVDALSTVGLPTGSPAQLDFALNVLLFLPSSLMGVFLFREHRVFAWLLIGLVGSVLIETVQGALLPDRVASGRDVVANTSGAFLGWLVSALGQVMVRRPLSRSRSSA